MQYCKFEHGYVSRDGTVLPKESRHTSCSVEGGAS